MEKQEGKEVASELLQIEKTLFKSSTSEGSIFMVMLRVPAVIAPKEGA